ncbi:MAG: hypothetical protein LQ343_003740 [Gyalolechia ehrenbergii]|nr:MAG: hypothetical protein LQ343_003740 [Gyalolechia ehrenbergii]
MDKTVGVLGGGQLGRMLTQAATRRNIKIITLDAENAPAKQINATSPHINGSFADPTAIRQLAERCDVLTVEIEHVNADVLEDIAKGIKSTQREVQPSWRTIRTIQDKFLQKEHLQSHNISTAPSVALDELCSKEELGKIGKQLGFPFMLKSRTEAYDGRGNYPIKSQADIPAGMIALQDRPLYAEKWANFQMELATMVVKTTEDAGRKWQESTVAYPVVETIHEDSICKLVYAPARSVSDSVLEKAQELARAAVATFWGKGVFGVEMFLLEDDEILVNEIAPRPHNSGHYTIEACPMSQYEAHLRAILGMPVTSEDVEFIGKDTNAIMLNILGGFKPTSHQTLVEKADVVRRVRVHLYGKGDARPGRKMGHVTLVTDSMSKAVTRMEPLISLADLIRAERLNAQTKPTLRKGGETNTQRLQNEPTSSMSPLVAVTMGSKSDSSVLAPGIKLLEQLEIPFTVTITSAHRTPEKMREFAKSAADDGIKIIIAAAGGAAHLPGMIAAHTWLPVVGVPVRGKVLDGLDSLLSQSQMPPGCPVATMGIDNSVNAAQYAARILALHDVNIRKRLKQYLADQTSSVLRDSDKLERLGFEAFCSQR